MTQNSPSKEKLDQAVSDIELLRKVTAELKNRLDNLSPQHLNPPSVTERDKDANKPSSSLSSPENDVPNPSASKPPDDCNNSALSIDYAMHEVSEENLNY